RIAPAGRRRHLAAVLPRPERRQGRAGLRPLRDTLKRPRPQRPTHPHPAAHRRAQGMPADVRPGEPSAKVAPPMNSPQLQSGVFLALLAAVTAAFIWILLPF